MTQENKIKEINDDSNLLKQKLRESYYNLDLKLGRINRSRAPNLSKMTTDPTQANPTDTNQLVLANLTSLVQFKGLETLEPLGLSSTNEYSNNYDRLKYTMESSQRSKIQKEEFENIYKQKKLQEQYEKD